MIYTYSSLMTEKPLLVSDHKVPYHFVKERHLHAIWYEQKKFKQLTTVQGEPITVISPGIWNFEGGPDFCKAHLKIGTKEYRGDIEIHLTDDSWYHHRHHVDDKYQQVILHISLWQPLHNKPLFTKEGKEIVRTYFEPVLSLPVEKIAQTIDLDLYPYQQFLGSGKCAQSLFHHLSEEKIRDFFQSAAEWRLVQKKQHLTSRVSDDAFQLGGGIAMALGYKHNAEAFLDLFLFLLPFRDFDEHTLLALAMGICGYFEDKFNMQWGLSVFYQELKTAWGGLISETLHQTQFRFDRIRPLNHPIRRLVYLVKLLNSRVLEQVATNLNHEWDMSWRLHFQSHRWKPLLQKLCAHIPSFVDPYWNIHYLFEEKQHAFLPLIGTELKTTILINTFFPLLYDAIIHRKVAYEKEALMDCYASIPAAKNSKSRYLSHRFFGDTTNKKTLSQANTEQGAYQLHKDFCLHFEASCSGCSFVERYKQTYG